MLSLPIDMLRTFLILLGGALAAFNGMAAAADAPPAAAAAPARAATALSPQELEAILVMAEQGDAGSQNYLGFLYATGQTVAKDEKIAFNWFQKAAAQKYPEALGNLAMMYEKGLGVAKNFQTALDFHRQAAMAGYPISMKRLANLYETGLLGEERDPIKAEMWKNRYKETLKTAAGGNTAKPAAEKPAASAPSEKAVTPKTAAPATPPKAPVTPAKPIVPAAASTPPSAKNKPYFIEISGKATAQETMAVTQKIVERNLLPQNKKIELVNPDGKSYRINIGPFADMHEATPYKSKIMLLLAPSPIPDTVAQQAAPAADAPPAGQPVQAATPAPDKPAAPPPSEKPAAKPPVPAAAPPPQPASPVVQAAAPAPDKPAAPSSSEKPAAKPSAAAPHAPATAAAKTETGGKDKPQYVEISGKATSREATELIQSIVEKGLLPKNMHVELVNPETDNYRIRIGPFPNGKDAASHTAKIRAASGGGQELVAVPPAAPPRKPESAKAAPVSATPKAAATPPDGNAPQKAVEEKPAAKVSHGRFYYVRLNAQNTFEDSLFLARFMFTKGLVHETYRVKIENLDGRSFHVSVGPFGGADEARQHLQKISQQTYLQASVATFEKRSSAEEGEGQPYIQINTHGTLENAVATTRTLLEKEFFTSSLTAEIVNFGSGNFRVRLGPYPGMREAGQSVQNLKNQFDAPVLVNLDRMVQLDGK